MSNHAISTARNVQEILQLNYIDNGYPKSLDNIIDIASQLSDKPIEYLEVQMFQEDSAVKGSCVISKDKYSILALAGLNPCWRRFVTCKEIMHALMDCDEYRNLNIDIHIEQS